jgi:hypothetical protein
VSSSGSRIFGLWGGPAAWFLQLCAGYALASWPCFPQDTRRLAPLVGYGWTTSALVAVSAAAFVTALAAYFVARQIHHNTREVDNTPAVVRAREADEANRGLLATGIERICFLALWGMAFAAGSAVAIAATALALLLLPRCAG